MRLDVRLYSRYSQSSVLVHTSFIINGLDAKSHKLVLGYRWQAQAAGLVMGLSYQMQKSRSKPHLLFRHKHYDNILLFSFLVKNIGNVFSSIVYQPC